MRGLRARSTIPARLAPSAKILTRRRSTLGLAASATESGAVVVITLHLFLRFTAFLRCAMGGGLRGSRPDRGIAAAARYRGAARIALYNAICDLRGDGECQKALAPPPTN